MNLPNLVFYYLSHSMPTDLALITAALSVEMFGYGFGFVGLILFMMQVVSVGKYQTAHYAFATGVMQLGFVLFKMISGDIQTALGYKTFFLWVLVSAMPVLVLSRFMRIGAKADAGKPDLTRPIPRASQRQLGHEHAWSHSFKEYRQAYDDKHPVIHGIDLDIGDGEFIVFVGPSGCGKSTLLRMIAGLEDISGGELHIGGKLANDIAPAERGLAMVFQSYALYPHMTVYENMAFALSLAGHKKAEVRAAVERAAEILQITPLLQAQTEGPVGRPAPARGDRPRHRAQAAGVPVRRTAVEPRRLAARADARGTFAPAPGTARPP